MTKLWGGRFNKNLANSAQKLSYSLSFDYQLCEYDLKLNLAFAKALKKINIITHDELIKLEVVITEFLLDCKAGKIDFSTSDEDIHSLVERLITEKLGDIGKKIHTGKSRNDQVITDTRLFLKSAISEIQELVLELQKVLYKLAQELINVKFIGFTHFQPAQPVLLSHHLLSYFEGLKRDQIRLSECFVKTDVCSLGSGALAGTNYEIDREFLAKELGFTKISQNSLDAVSDRDFLLEFMNTASLIMLRFSRLAEELILWSSPLLGFIEIDDAFTTGSSIMPQKKNPDMAELIRAKTSRVIGNQVGLLTLLKALPLAYNRDLQEDKIYVFETVDILKTVLNVLPEMLSSLKINEEKISTSLSKGYLCATELADYLVLKGIPFRSAHEITGKIVLYALENQKQLKELSLTELNGFSEEIKDDIYDYFDETKAINRKNVFGGTAVNQVKSQLQKIKEEYQW